MQYNYYKDELLLFVDPDRIYWPDFPEEKWKEASNRVRKILRELDLSNDKAANTLAKNIWYKKRYDENMETIIRKQLKLYREYYYGELKR